MSLDLLAFSTKVKGAAIKMEENIERVLEIGIGMLLCIVAIGLIFIYQDIVDVGYKLLVAKNGG